MLALTHLSTILAFCMGAHPTLKDQERVDSPLSFSDEASPLQPAMKIDGMWPLGGLDGVGNDVAGRRGKWAPGIRPSIREGVNNGRGGRGPHASEGAVYPIRRDLRMEG